MLLLAGVACWVDLSSTQHATPANSNIGGQYRSTQHATPASYSDMLLMMGENIARNM